MTEPTKQPQKLILTTTWHDGMSKITVSERHMAPRLELLSESGVDDGAFFPAQHISIYGAENLAALQDAITTALERWKENQDIINPPKV